MTVTQHTISASQGSRKTRKRRGKGNASGLGTYSGRGMKGQRSRSGGTRGRRAFEGGQTPIVQRMPKLKGFKNPNRVKYQVVNVKDLGQFENGTLIDLVALYEQKLISKKNLPVKILGEGTLKKKLQVRADAVSKSAKEKIEGAGGTVDTVK